MISNYPQKRPEIMKMTVSWKRFNNRTERDSEEEESLFEAYIKSTHVIFYK